MRGHIRRTQQRERGRLPDGRSPVKVFVTGATGYIGGSVAVRLLQAGHTVRRLAAWREPVPAVLSGAS
ncbi:NAD-dependent epimerase/dehydratase family protein [Streptomyces sp. NBC_01803]|uniref:NAD-dependent epimerase/dehydratase family protein n=1 Tax=Streptomyces sp. NBC_01803 TaxID=2975946 RepID=UPI002DD84666|nr:NAD-dependent epimerase/dehydratase family protein [Streptomyces sp. NBC_01803]